MPPLATAFRKEPHRRAPATERRPDFFRVRRPVHGSGFLSFRDAPSETSPRKTSSAVYEKRACSAGPFGFLREKINPKVDIFI